MIHNLTRGTTLLTIVLTVIFIVLIAGMLTARGADLIVKDGDTIVWRGETVRLFGVDSPENDQDGGLAAKKWVEDRLAGVNISLRRVKGKNGKTVDMYGRTIAVLYDGTSSINKELVLAGHAWAYRDYSTTYVRHENEARAAKRGLWAFPCPMAPWAYRQMQRR